jgi:hypothetical protein
MVKTQNGTQIQRDPVVQDFVSAVAGGEHWAQALIKAMASWQLAEETIGDRHYRYLIGGEAFDWLVLAERLLDEVAEFVPDRERVALIFDGAWPEGVTEENLRDGLGPARYAAHLNFQYGVVVEEALQLAFEQEVQKERTSRVWGDDARTAESEQAMERLYGCSREQLLAMFQEERPDMHLPPDALGLGDVKEFLYWLFQYRVKMADPARVASDTRRGLALLSQMESEVRFRRRQLRAADDVGECLETSGWFAHSAR